MLYQIIFRSLTFPFQKDTAIRHLVMDLVQTAHVFVWSIVWKRMSLKQLTLGKLQTEDREDARFSRVCIFYFNASNKPNHLKISVSECTPKHLPILM